MEKELIIAVTPNEVHAAILQDKRLIELHQQQNDTLFAVGDIYLGKVTKYRQEMNACFVSIGHEKDAFLHYHDLGPQLRSLQKFCNGAITGGQPKASLDNFILEADIDKNGKITDVFDKKKPILVQLVKEPISTKGHRVTCEITVPGRNIVMTPFVNTVSVSKKIVNPEERKRLQKIAQGIKPKNFGLIIRTAAEGCESTELHKEVNDLLKKWEVIHKNLHKAQAPKKIMSELDKTNLLLRDFLNDSFTHIHVDNALMAESIKDYLEVIAPSKVNLVKLYKGTKPIFDHFTVNKQVKTSFGKISTLPSGTYIVIEHTEAMHVIDVNSGNRTSNGDQEQNAISVNIEAAEEIARQLKLRDIGGLIMIDFIDMKSADNKRILHTKITEFMQKDSAKHTILPLSKFGVMQITRQRVRPETNISTADVCPTCQGLGNASPVILVVDNLVRDLEFILKAQPKVKLTILVHPFLKAYLTEGFPSIRMKWLFDYHAWIKVKADENFSITDYQFLDGFNEEIRLES